MIIRLNFLAAFGLLVCNTLFASTDVDFNGDWRFQRGDIPEAIEADYDDSNWRSVTLPHDWSIEGPFSESNPALSRGAWLPAGKGVYRKTFTVSADPKTDKVFVYFDGAYRNSVVYLNGQKVGNRPFGYIGFEYDLTEFIDFSGPNVLVVTLDNSDQPGSRWYSGSGIYRDVMLKVRNRVHIPNWGLHVITPIVSEDRGRVAVTYKVNNEFSVSKRIQSNITLSKDGAVVATFDGKIDVASTSQLEQRQLLDVNSPKLWSLESPELYDLTVRLSEGESVLHEESVRVGFRTFSFDKEKGFAINGTWTKIKGVCLHHDGGPLGAAVQRRTLERQLEKLREMGCNAIRTGHTPFSTEFLDLCDEMGFLVMNDVFDEWANPKRVPVMRNGAREMAGIDYYAKYFDDWFERDFTDFVLRDRNHPSIFMWGIGAKVHSRMKPDELSIARELTSMLSKLDDRPVMNGVADDGSSIVGELKAQLEFEGQRTLYPESALLVGECYSAQSFYPRGTYLHGDVKQAWWDALDYEQDATFEWADRRGHISVEGIDAWRVTKGASNVMGQFIWAGWDYLGETVPFGWPARSSSFAPIDLAGFPKDGFYFYQSQWTNDPMVHIFPHWNLEGREGEMVTVYAFTNGDEVELFQDGKSLGKRKNDPGKVEYQTWDVVYQPGALKGVAFKNGNEVASKEVVTTGRPAKISLYARRKVLEANGEDLLYVECSILDANGHVVPTAGQELSFEVSGAAELIATGNGNPFDHTSFQAPKRNAFNGRCLAILKTKKQGGLITIDVSGNGLESGSLQVRSK